MGLSSRFGAVSVEGRARLPFAFPSHPGLIAPLWRRWPARFNALGCIVGAMVPDAVDGVLGLARGHLGQWYGHSLAGLLGLCLPVGLLATWGVEAAGWRLRRASSARAVRAGAWIEAAGATPGREGWRARAVLVAFSVWIGALSHLVFDFVSHGNFLWLLPWYEPARFFPEWWYARWFSVPLPGYRAPYPIGPHFGVWLILSVVGAAVWLAPALRRVRSDRA